MTREERDAKRQSGLGQDQIEALWRRAELAGMERRRFLLLLAAGGATAVLGAIISCVPGATPTLTPSPTSTPTASPSPSPSPTGTPVSRLIDEPTPEQFFVPIGGGNVEMRFELMANRTYAMPNSFFFVRDHTSTPVVDVKGWSLSIEGDGISKPFQLSYDDR